MGWILLIAAAASAACPDRAELIDKALDAVVSADLFGARNRLTELEGALACGVLATQDELVSMWLLEGALSTFSGDREGASDAFRAAAVQRPSWFIDDLGAPLRADYDAACATPVSGTGTLVIEPVLAGWTLAVDGESAEFPVTVSAGLHVVQVGSSDDAVGFARVIHVSDGATVVIDTQLRPVLPRDPVSTNPRVDGAPQPAVQPPSSLVLGWTASAGVGVAVGARLEDAVGTEPALKVMIPLETGVRLRGEHGWLRAAVGAGPLLGGDFVYSQSGRAVVTPVSLGTHLAGGWRSTSLAAGAAVGIQWPERVGVRGIVALPLGQAPLELEARLGVNALAERAPEPAAELVLSFVLERE